MSVSAPSERVRNYYEFDGFHFYPDERLLLRVRDGHPFRLMPKAGALLHALLKRCGEVVTYAELKKEVWPDSPHVLTHTIRETKHAIVKVLGESAGRLETVAGKGYRLNVNAVVRRDEGDIESGVDRTACAVTADTTPQPQALELGEVGPIESGIERGWIGLNLSRYFAGHFWHVVTSCSLYALLYAIALFVEIAYRYDRYGAAAMKLAPLVFLWTLGTSMLGLSIAWKRELREKSKGLVLPLLIFISAGLLLYVALGSILPKTSITEADFQTYTAQGAYLKSVGYFLFLAVVFLIIPFHFVLSLQREVRAGRGNLVLDLLNGERRSIAPKGAAYLKVWWLGLLLLAVAVISPVLMAHLFDNLKPHPYMNFFMQLAIWRMIIYLSLGMECLLWYYATLIKIRRSC